MSLKQNVKNANEMVNAVCRSMLDYTGSYNQGMWCVRNPNHTEVHTCNTAFCIAGFAVAIVHGPKKAWRIEQEKDDSDYRLQGIYYTARELFGDKSDRYGEGDEDFHEALSNLFSDESPEGSPGTRAYARSGVQKVRAFQREWKTRLLNTPIGGRK